MIALTTVLFPLHLLVYLSPSLSPLGCEHLEALIKYNFSADFSQLLPSFLYTEGAQYISAYLDEYFMTAFNFLC